MVAEEIVVLASIEADLIVSSKRRFFQHRRHYIICFFIHSIAPALKSDWAPEYLRN